MLIHHIRNATMVVSAGDNHILVDPMLSAKGALPSLKWLTLHRRRNPTVDLPKNASDLLAKVTHCLITHCRKGHFDHLDRPALKHLMKNRTPVYCSGDDAQHLSGRHLTVLPLRRHTGNRFLQDGTITPVSCRHGWGWISSLMANGVGYFLQVPDEPTLYITGDTVLTQEVRDAITRFQPEWLVLAAGGARLDIGKPLLMTCDELFEAITLTPGKVILNHQEALDHCPVTRSDVRQFLSDKGIQDKTVIPMDGASIKCGRQWNV